MPDDPPPTTVTPDCCPTCAETQAMVAALTARVAALETTARANRDEADAAVRQVLPRSTRGLKFRTKELMAHATVDAELRRALVAADLTTAPAIGTWLRDSKRTLDGVTITREGRSWRATYTSDTYVHGSESAL